MKLDLKAGEHVRIAHDAKSTFSVFIGKGYMHIRAHDPKDASDTIVSFADEAGNESPVRIAA